MSKSHHTQGFGKHPVYKLVFGHVQILENYCCYIVIQTYESTVSITKLNSFAEFRKRKSKYITQFLKMNPHFTIYFGRFPRTNSALKMKKKKLNLLKKGRRGEDTMQAYLILKKQDCKTTSEPLVLLVQTLDKVSDQFGPFRQ